MTANETLAVLGLAKATTADARRKALYALAGGRIGDVAKSELLSLAKEVNVSSNQLFRLPSAADKCPSLSMLPPYRVEPLLSPQTRSLVDEWVEGWTEADTLLQANQAPPGPLLLQGPTGSGKSTTAVYIADRLKEKFGAAIGECHSIVAGYVGQSGVNIATLFATCHNTRSLLLLEELDGLGSNRAHAKEPNGAEMESARISIALMRLIDTCKIPLIATTNRPDLLDTALVNRFEFSLEFDEPTDAQKQEILLRATGLAFQLDARLQAMPLNILVKLARRAARLSLLRKHDYQELIQALAA